MSGDASQYRSCSPKDCLNQQGVILVLVLVLLGLISALAIQAQMTASMLLRLERARTAQTQLRAATLDAVWGVLLALGRDAEEQVDHTNKFWAEPVSQLLPNGVEITLQLEDADRYFNINNLCKQLPEDAPRQPWQIVADLLALANQPAPVPQAQSLRDWLRVPSTNSADELNHALADRPGGVPLESPQELVQALAQGGASGTLPAGLTVLPAPSARRLVISNVFSSVNLNTADNAVILAVLGPRNAAAAAALDRLRASGPLISLAPLGRLLPAGQEQVWNGYFDVKSAYFSVTARAVKEDAKQEVYALVHRDQQGNVEIIRWVNR